MLNDKKRLDDSNHLQSELDNPISIEEIDKAIKKLKNKKAAGLDGIRNEMIKTSSSFIKYPLEKLFNLILQSGTCLLYTSPSPRDGLLSRMPSSA